MKGWKTILFNAAVAMVPLIDLLLADGTILTTLMGSPERATATMTVLGAVNVLLRAVTNTPVFENGKPRLPHVKLDEQGAITTSVLRRIQRAVREEGEQSAMAPDPRMADLAEQARRHEVEVGRRNQALAARIARESAVAEARAELARTEALLVSANAAGDEDAVHAALAQREEARARMRDLTWGVLKP